MRASCASCLEETLVVAEDAPRTAPQGGLELLDGGDELSGVDFGGPLCGGPRWQACKVAQFPGINMFPDEYLDIRATRVFDHCAIPSPWSICRRMVGHLIGAEYYFIP